LLLLEKSSHHHSQEGDLEVSHAQPVRHIHKKPYVEPRSIFKSASFYPLTGLYLSGVALLLLVARGWLEFWIAFILYALIMLGALVWATKHEVEKLRDEIAKLKDGST
jgi:hypothetical protein